MRLKRFKQDPITGHIRKVRAHIDLNMSLPAEVLVAGQGAGMPPGTHFMIGAVPHIGESPDSEHYIWIAQDTCSEWHVVDDRLATSASEAALVAHGDP